MNTNTHVNAGEYPLKEQEKAVLSALLVKPAMLPDVTAILREEMFYLPEAGFIYSAICRLYNEGKQPDFLTVEAEMRRMDEDRTERMGGIGWLGYVMSRVRHGGNVKLYAEDIKRHFLLRLLESHFRQLAEEAGGCRKAGGGFDGGGSGGGECVVAGRGGPG